MITLLTLIVGIISFKWLVMWDKSIKNKTNILEYLPENEIICRMFLALTFFSAIILMVLMIMYLP